MAKTGVAVYEVPLVMKVEVLAVYLKQYGQIIRLSNLNRGE